MPSITLIANASALVDELLATSDGRVYRFEQIRDLPALAEVLDSEPELQVAIARECVERVAAMCDKLGRPKEMDPRYMNLRHQDGFPGAAVIVLTRLLRRRLPYSECDLVFLAERTASLEMVSLHCLQYVEILVSTFERVSEQCGVTKTVRDALTNLSGSISRYANADYRRLVTRIRGLIVGPVDLPIEPGEAWASQAIEDLQSFEPAVLDIWIKLLLHCDNTASGKPTAKWLKTAAAICHELGRPAYRSSILKWFPMVDKPRVLPLDAELQRYPHLNFTLSERHSNILKGLVLCCSFAEDKEISRSVSALAISAYKKLPGIGPRLVKVGNACIYTLGSMPGMEGLGQLAILKVRVKFGSAQKEIEKALVATAERVGIPRSELEEMAVPTYGLSAVGFDREQLGEFHAELKVFGEKAELRWFKGDGKEQKSVPAAIKQGFAEELKDLKTAAKDIEKMIPAQAARIEQTYLQRKEWVWPLWRERYFDHPLVGTIARRLIWRFHSGEQSASAIYHEGRWVAAHDNPVEWMNESTKVTLWHPLEESAESISEWRLWLTEHEVKQPFKQAHREVYLLTDAERNTDVYSNRFAAHLLKQHQFNALCGARGWKNKLRLMVDDTYPPANINLPAWNLRAEFWIEGAGTEYGIDTNDTGTFLYLTTDQVRFYRTGAAVNEAHAAGGGYTTRGINQEDNRPLSLRDVPALAFSEILRDVDLFVGVASVGNDQNWADGGPQGRYREYWQNFSFGDLGATAQTRKSFLQTLIPRLRISDRCSFGEKFLAVRGDLRTYKIHLGSGNILMEPNDQYLCIVPRQSVMGKREGVFLPFEGDNMLSIILSKAFLLAEDTKITDSTITSQIGRM